MCGIIGYSGSEDSVPIVLEGLRTLEYRGYDSAGISVATENGIKTVKSRGRLAVLEEKLKDDRNVIGNCAIGHTRWATHGEPSDINSHPHSTKNLTLVHNGIIENYAEISEMLVGAGYTFESETDTESAAKLIDMLFLKYGDPIRAIAKATRIIRGSYAFGIIFADLPNTIYAIRKDSPLIVAKNSDGGFIASDIPAILKHTREYYRLDEGIIAKVSDKNAEFFDLDGRVTHQKLESVDWDVEQAQKGGYPFFMLKEIYEEPEALRKTLEPRIVNGLPHFSIPEIDGDLLSRFGAIHIVACGSAMHAGLVGKAIIERLARVPVNVEIASEFRYKDPILAENDLVILISQSGETADTLAALRHARSKGVYTLAIVNVIGSSVAREADSVMYTRAGPEIAVATTKAYSVQCALLYLLALKLAQLRGTMTEAEVRDFCEKMLSEIPASVAEALKHTERIRECASRLVAAEHLFYLGRDLDCSLCTEASLKLKEISYIHSEAYAAGELKHGTISLVTENTPVIALTTVEKVLEKTVSAIREVKSRGAYVISVCSGSLADRYNIPCDELIVIPDTDPLLSAFPAICILQLLAYHVSSLKGLDVDKPRNLAKSVTVE